MASKNANDAAKKKAAKERKMLVVLIVFLVLALGYAYKTLTKLHGSSAPEPVAAATTTSAGASAPSTASTPPASSSSSSSPSSVDVPSGATAPSSGSASGADRLVSAVTPPLDQGQLRTFTLFDTKDPFNSQGPAPTGKSGPGVGTGTQSPPSSGQTGSSSQPASSGSSSSSSASGASSGAGSKPAVAPPTSAVISVNGNPGLVSLNTVFPVTNNPASDGIFRLVGLTRATAKIAVVGGSYASGAPTLTLHVGQAVTLANTADGKRYTLELFPQGTTVAPAPTDTSGSGTPTDTTATTPGS